MTIFATTTPKGGTHLLLAVLSELTGEPPQRFAKPRPKRGFGPWLAEHGHPPLVFDHLRYHPGLEPPSDMRLIAIVRDPRAVVLSFRDYIIDPARDRPTHVAIRESIQGLAKDEQIMRLTDGRALDLTRHCSRFLDWAGVGGHLVRFEDFFSDEAAAKLHRALPEFSLARIQEVIAEKRGASTPTFHIGDPDRWRHELSPEVLEYIEVHAESCIRSLGYELLYR